MSPSGALGWILAAILVVIPSGVFRVQADGTNPEAPWRLVNFAADAGVHRRQVFNVAFQPDNTAWFAVSDGLYRYDGYRWRRFTVEDGLPSSFIRTVTVTRGGVLWVGTDQGAGVFSQGRFDPAGTEGRLAGPNVRRIVEGPDGALWFCCDRWPDPGARGGLTRLKNGAARTFGRADGLPSDHLVNLTILRDGTPIAVTPRGLAALHDDHWGPLPAAGYPDDHLPWDAVESPEGDLLLAMSGRAMRLRAGQWEPCPGVTGEPRMTLGRDGLPLCIRAGRNGKARFLRWSGDRFEPASDGFDRNDLEFEAIAEAPDGAIWGVGRGTILRWENKPGRWQWHPELPPPVAEDRSGRMWFADGNGAVALAGTEVITVPGLRAPLAFDPAGGVWGNGTNGLARWTENGLESIPEAVSGLASVKKVVVDGTGVLWFDGVDSADARRLASMEGNRWTQVQTGAFTGQILSQPVADTGRGIWTVATSPDLSEFTVYRVRGAEPERQDIAEGGSAFGNPRILADSDRVYLMGYRGLWESPKAQPWHLKASDAGPHVFNLFASIGDVSAFTSQEGPDGSARVHVLRAGQWLSHPVRHGQSLWLGEDGWLLVGDGSEIVLWQTRLWSIPTYLGLPVDTTILSMVRAHDGNFWVHTRMGVIGMDSGSVPPPETLVEGPEHLIEGTDARVLARGAEAFAPMSSHRRFSFTWRLDSREWSGYGDWPETGLALGNVAVGHHSLEVRARDGLGNEDPTPARLEFEVLRLPIEDRRWFRPALGAAGLSFAFLSLSLLGLSRRLRQQARGLEAEVRARTSELEADVNRRREAELAALQSNERLGLALQAGLFGVWDWDATTNHSAWDDRMYEIFGLDRSEFDGSHESWFRRVVPEDRAQVESAMRRALEAETTYTSRYRIRLPNGSIRHVAAEGYVNRDASGRLVRVIGLNADVTEQETTREELLRREDRIRRLNECISRLVLAGADPNADPLVQFQDVAERVSDAVRTARVGIWQMNADRARMHCTLLFGTDERHDTPGGKLVCGDFPGFFEALEIQSRVSVEDLGTDPRTVGMVEGGFAPPGTRSMLAAAIRVGGRLSWMICLEHVGPPRRWHPDEQGFVSTVAAILAQTLETAERRRAEGELLKNRDLLNATGRLAGVGGWELAVTGSIPGELTWTDQVRHIHEVDAGFRPDLPATVGFVAPEWRPRFEQAVADLLALAKPFDLELVVITAKGRRVPVRSIGNPELQDGRVVRVVGAIQDISDRRIAETALREERVRLASIIEAARVGTWEWNVQTGETVFNERWAEILGHSLAELAPVSIQTWIRLTHPEDLTRSDAMLQEHFAGRLDYYECECRMRHRDGHWVWIQDRGRVVTRDASGRPLMMFGTHTDVTERRQSEERQRGLQELLNRAERMESVGRLAGGVAHDFNNMLQSILGYATLALMDVPRGTPLAENLEEIRRSAERSADLTRQLLAFARKQTAAPKVVDLNATISGMLKMLRRLIGENIALDWRPGDGLWPVTVDPGQIDQILANLCVNARDAIEGSGRISIVTANEVLDAAAVSGHPGTEPGEFVRIAVKDTGHGMTPEVLESIFEPFFTTKEVGRGTGLGLATVFGIVTQNKGLIEVSSTPGAGTTFVIHLPRTEAAGADAAPEPARKLASASGTLLLVEDEEQVLRFTRQVLLRAGYTVLAASRPAAALELAARHPGSIDLLITDVVMPGMNGRQLHDLLLERHAGLRCLYMSGYTADIIANHGVLQDGVAFLQKPFGVEQLAAKVRDLFSGAGP